MRPDDFIPATFTFTAAAHAFLPVLRKEAEREWKEPLEVLTVAWGEFIANDGRRGGRVVVSFYGRSEMTDLMRTYVQRVDGVDVMFFAAPENAARFAGKQIDFSNDCGFFLRDMSVSQS